MAVSDYSPTPANNTTISGLNIDENCTPGVLNNAIRQLMADLADLLANDIPDTSTLAPLASPAFTGSPSVSGRGAVLHHEATVNASGRVYILADGSPNPSSPSNGDIVFNYTP